MQGDRLTTEPPATPPRSNHSTDTTGRCRAGLKECLGFVAIGAVLLLVASAAHSRYAPRTALCDSLLGQLRTDGDTRAAVNCGFARWCNGMASFAEVMAYVMLAIGVCAAIALRYSGGQTLPRPRGRLSGSEPLSNPPAERPRPARLSLSVRLRAHLIRRRRRYRWVAVSLGVLCLAVAGIVSAVQVWNAHLSARARLQAAVLGAPGLVGCVRSSGDCRVRGSAATVHFDFYSSATSAKAALTDGGAGETCPGDRLPAKPTPSIVSGSGGRTAWLVCHGAYQGQFDQDTVGATMTVWPVGEAVLAYWSFGTVQEPGGVAPAGNLGELLQLVERARWPSGLSS
jgi:hypothetical protein